MDIQVLRYSTKNNSTLGILSIINSASSSDNYGDFLCYTLEDMYWVNKIAGKTRIPEGVYSVQLRTFGGFHNRYKVKFKFYKGMLWIKDVPDFTDILIHIGNKISDTKGCILVGDIAYQNGTKNGTIGHSKKAYIRIYKIISKVLLSGEEVTIRFVNIG